MTPLPLPDHLGGHCYITNMDLGVFNELRARHSPRSFLDIGCGPGGMVAHAAGAGLRARGIDGDFTLAFDGLDVLVHDFTAGPAPLDAAYDLGWCVEVLEHVHERFLDNVRPAFQACTRLWVTHAVPGQDGWHHVNCQATPYWVEVFRRWGFRVDMAASETLRRRTTMAGPYSKRSGLLLERP